MLCESPFLEKAAIALSLSIHHYRSVLSPLPQPVLRVLTFKESSQGEVTEQPDLADVELRLIPKVAQLPVGHPLVGLADALAKLRHLREVLAHPHCLKPRVEVRRVHRP